MHQSDRREFQRLRLAKPILAVMRGQPALVLDIGIAGAFIEHHGTAAAGERYELAFHWKGKVIEYECEVRRSFVVRTPGSDGISDVSHSGVRFVEPRGISQLLLQDMITTSVGQILAAQRANAVGQRGRVSAGESILARLGEARRIRSNGFVTYRLDGIFWSRTASLSPEQPSDGFTVASWEDEDEVEALCRTYEEADEEGRRLIRLVAELSVMQR
jgi:hypothetical protein